VAAGTAAKLATDVALLSQNEIAEVHEGGAGGRSSSMAHKRNPVGSLSVLACAHRVPGLVATLLAAMPQEHERAAGRWQAEWPTLLDLLRVTGSAAAWAAELAAGLEVDAQRMAGTGAASPAPEGDVSGAARRPYVGGAPRAMSVPLHHVVSGPAEAPPLLLGNSLGTDLRMWDRVVEELGDAFRIGRFDHRGQGASPVPGGPYDIADLGEDVVALLDELEIDAAAFRGVSIGGMVGL
jgi:hypothetical protein